MSCYNLYKVPPEHFVVLHQADGAGALSTTTYAVENTDLEALDQPQLSPDGRFVALRLGQIDGPNPNYHLYVLDTQQKRMRYVPTEFFCVPSLSWSPDGAYLAYIVGGDRQGLRWYGDRTLRLMVVDWRTGKSRQIAEDDGVKRGFSWAPPHTLFYSAQAKPGPKQKRTRAAIYQADARSGKPQLLLRAASSPVVSPSGRRIAFFDQRNPSRNTPSDWEAERALRTLGVAMRDGTHRRTLGVEPKPPAVLWLPDERRLLAVEHIGSSPSLKARVRQCDLQSGRWRELGSLGARDSEKYEIDTLSSRCQPLRVSSDGSTLFCNMLSVLGKDAGKPDRPVMSQTLTAFDLKTGQQVPLATWRSDYSHAGSFFDLHQSVAASAQP